MSVADAGIAAREARHSRIVPALLACSAAAWVALVVVAASPWSAAFEHRALEDLGAHRWEVATLAAGWVLMVAAMMVPTSLPLFALFERLTATRPDRRQLMVILVGVYLLVWSAIGVAMHLADFGVHRLVDHWVWLQAHAWAIPAVTLGIAGGYQLSALKERCATRCRTPQGFIRAHWHGGSAPAETWRLALDHAASCAGCCWALMLVMFSVGVGSIAWMAALTAVMAVEKTHEVGPALRRPVAIWLLAGALFTVIAG
jgi:predicted metal-binding membrane protein